MTGRTLPALTLKIPGPLTDEQIAAISEATSAARSEAYVAGWADAIEQVTGAPPPKPRRRVGFHPPEVEEVNHGI